MVIKRSCRRNQKIALYLIMALILIPISLTAKEGGISPDTLAAMRSSFEINPQTRAVYNAITGNDIDNLALNRELLNRHNAHFNHKLDIGDIADQKSSGRCWLFASLNILRPMVIKKHNL